jgi:nucleoside-diphosphate-sugar epimerase
MLAMQALANDRITVFGGDQTRPNMHIQDMLRVYHHFLVNGAGLQGIYNAGFENISILDIAQRVTEVVPAQIIVTPSNDPRSYRLSSKKLLATGFAPKFTVSDAIAEIIKAFRDGRLKDDDLYYNIRTMKKLSNLA